MVAARPILNDNPQMVIPAGNAVLYTPHDTNELDYVSRGILIETTGPIKVKMADNGEEIVIPSIAGGVIHPLRVTKIFDTGTTATSVVVFW